MFTQPLDTRPVGRAAGAGLRAAARARPATKSGRREASVDSLLAAALELFVTRGYRATSVDEVARAAGLSKGAVYFYFRGKSNLLDALLDRAEGLVFDPTIAAMDAAGDDPRERLNAFVRTQSVIGAERTGHMLLAILMGAELNGSGEPAEARLRAMMGRMEGALADTVRRGQAGGVFRGGVGADEIAGVVMAINKGCYVEWHMRGRDLDGPGFARAFRDFIVDGVAARRPGHGQTGGTA